MVIDDNESFNVLIDESGSITKEKIVFNKDGVFKWDKIPESRVALLRYSEVMPDMTGEPCGVWYQNLVLPPEINIKDNACCLTYKNPRNEFV